MEYAAGTEVVSKHRRVDRANKEEPLKSLTNCLIHMDVWYFPYCTRALGLFKEGNKQGSNEPSPRLNRVGG